MNNITQVSHPNTTPKTPELLTYIGFLSEDECRGFLDTIRPAPFIPTINLMWTEQVIDYLMLADRSADDEKVLSSGVPYATKYVRRHTPEDYWHMLPRSWAANYYTPSKVLLLAVHCRNENDFCKYVSEKLFIRAAGLADSVQPVTKLPEALPMLPKPMKRKVSNSVTLRNFNDGTNISVAVKGGRPEVVRKERVRVSTPRRNPAIGVPPAFANSSERARYWKSPEGKALNREIEEIIKREYVGFGGTKKAEEIAEEFHLAKSTVHNRALEIRKAIRKASQEELAEVSSSRNNPVASVAPTFALRGNSQEVRKMSKEIDSYIEVRYSRFGGTDTAQKIADDTGLTRAAICQRVQRIKVRRDQEAGTNKYAEIHYSSGNPSLRIEDEKRERIFEAIKTRLYSFGGKDGPIELAKEFSVSDGTINRFARMLRAQQNEAAFT